MLHAVNIRYAANYKLVHVLNVYTNNMQLGYCKTAHYKYIFILGILTSMYASYLFSIQIGKII